MTSAVRVHRLLAATAVALLLAGCGGGGGGPKFLPTPTPTPTPPPPPPPPPPSANDAEYQASNSAVTAKALAAYEAGATGENVKVAVIDTGINPNLPEFAGRIDPASQDVAANRGLSDDNGHGSMVSGVIAANRDGLYMQGVAYEAMIVSLNVGDPAGCKPGNDCFLDSAIDDAIDLARLAGAKIINMSFGDEEGMTPDVWPAIQRAIDAGIIIIMSAGNGGTASPNGFAEQNIATNGGSGLFIIAGAMTESRTIASFSDRAGEATTANWYLTALGVGNATVDENGAHVQVSGTSFAAPTIAGAAALLAGAFPNLTGAQIVELLLGSADDAGEAGTDSTFGRGILNIEQAFAPKGATTLAGTSMAISLSDNGTSSGPMGDASARGGAGAIILDGYSRAYVVDLARTLRRSAQDQPLRRGLETHGVETATSRTGPVSVTLTVRRDPLGQPRAETRAMRLRFEEARDARAVAGLAVSRIGPDTAIALGIGQSGRTLQQQLSRQAPGAFLVAQDPLSRAGFHADPATSFGIRHQFGPVALTATSERGRQSGWNADPALDRPGYASHALTLDGRVGPAILGLGVTALRESETVLGGRLSPLFMAGGSRTTFLDATARLPLGAGWDASASYRRGWTAVGATGSLAQRGRLASEAFAADLSRTGLLVSGDRLAWRFAQPLRVASGGFDLNVPVAWDYRTGTPSYGERFLSLSPGGRELDYELSYGTGLFGGFLELNGFVRTDPGHIEAMERDSGMALRFTLRH